MKKGAPVFLVIMFIAFSGIIKAYGLDEWFVIPSLSYAGDFTSQADDDADILFGIGLNVPLLFSRKDVDEVDVFLMIEPMVSTEYSFFTNLLRIRTGAHFGRFGGAFFMFGGYYIGLSGAFIQDFADDAVAFGISPEIGVEFYILLLGFRFQAQYDFYTDERYNRFIFTISLNVLVPISRL